jgi:hypothetical protein
MATSYDQTTVFESLSLPMLPNGQKRLVDLDLHMTGRSVAE